MHVNYFHPPTFDCPSFCGKFLLGQRSFVFDHLYLLKSKINKDHSKHSKVDNFIERAHLSINTIEIR